MVKEELKYQILQQFGFQPTSEQAHALEVLLNSSQIRPLIVR